MSKNFKDYSYKLGGHSHNIEKRRTLDDDRWFYGTVSTYWGIVLVLSEPGERPMTSLTFVLEGVSYCRDYEEFYEVKYLITLAKRFAEKVTLEKKRASS